MRNGFGCPSGRHVWVKFSRRRWWGKKTAWWGCPDCGKTTPDMGYYPGEEW